MHLMSLNCMIRMVNFMYVSTLKKVTLCYFPIEVMKFHPYQDGFPTLPQLCDLEQENHNMGVMSGQ